MDSNQAQPPQQSPKQDKGQDKLDILLKKWQKETRDEIKKKGEYDFLKDPQNLMTRIKDDSKGYVEEQWSLKSQYTKTKNVLKQFYSYHNPHNELLKGQPSLILKTRRIEYLFEKFKSIEEPKTLTDAADLQFINEMKFWSAKYVTLSWIIGANMAYFSYHLAFKYLKLYLCIPFTVIVLYEARNLALRNCLDKIYFPVEPIYKKIRGEDKRKIEREAGPSTKQEMKAEDIRKGDEMSEERFNISIQTQAEQELRSEQAATDQKLETFIYQIHGRFVNEDDFVNGKEGYQKFVNHYISLYYEPLDEEYDEARYMTKAFDDNLFKKLRYKKNKKITSIEIK